MARDQRPNLPEATRTEGITAYYGPVWVEVGITSTHEQNHRALKTADGTPVVGPHGDDWWKFRDTDVHHAVRGQRVYVILSTKPNRGDGFYQDVDKVVVQQGTDGVEPPGASEEAPADGPPVGWPVEEKPTADEGWGDHPPAPNPIDQPPPPAPERARVAREETKLPVDMPAESLQGVAYYRRKQRGYEKAQVLRAAVDMIGISEDRFPDDKDGSWDDWYELAWRMATDLADGNVSHSTDPRESS